MLSPFRPRLDTGDHDAGRPSAESERNRRAKVIHAMGEKEAAHNLGDAAAILGEHPAALQLRILNTLLEVGSERNSVIAFPLPMELLRLLDTKKPAGD